ncbi:acetyl-CoA synthetase-like protein [Coniochaeta sp. 2T2.1]|nr:acetyl-CoA synthetase-like protein [Coniochaeta sp. 2T2.1]
MLSSMRSLPRLSRRCGLGASPGRIIHRAKTQQAPRCFSALTTSISQGPDEPPLLPHTIPDHFASIVSQFGDHNAVIARSPTAGAETLNSHIVPQAIETALTYEALDLTSNVLAHSLRSLGVKKGDRVAVSLGNCPEFAALTYAVFKLGAILVPLNPGFNAKQVTAALTHLGVETLIIGAVTDLAYKPCRGRSNLPLLQALVPDLEASRLESPTVPTLRNIVVADNTPSHPLIAFPLASYPSLTPFSTLLPQGFHNLPSASSSSARRTVPDAPLSASETINIQFTSGTTSHPKAAMLSHTSILNNGALIGSRMGLTPTDKIVCPPPLFHCFGCVLGYMATATSGSAILFPSPAFDPLASIRMAADHTATGLYGVATMFVAMLEVMALQGQMKDPVIDPRAIERFPTHLRKGIAAGSSVPESLMRRLYDKIGLDELVICYGMTETAPVSCMTTPTDPLDKRTKTVGRVMPHTRVKVVDPTDRTKIVPVGERGELAASGYLVMKGYWGDERRTNEVRLHEDDGIWMYSGDEALMSGDGYVEITGRIKDLIIRGGENIHPLEIENCLFQHPLIAEVSVVGVPDERYGECVGAFVVLHKGVHGVEAPDGLEGEAAVESAAEAAGEGEGRKTLITKEEVREWVRTHLSPHLVPKYVFWLEEYPKTASGKIQKFKLRERARREVFGEEEGGGK